MKTLIIESWRAIPHSYAVINQFQCLELLKRPQVHVFHRDLPYHNPTWRPVVGLFSTDDEAALRSIPAPVSGQGVDATMRIGYPLDFSPAAGSARTVVWGTSEYGCLQSRDVVGGRSLAAGVETGVLVVTCSNWARSGFMNAGLDPSRIFVVPLGYDPRLFAPPSVDERAALRDQLGWEGFHFLNIGAMTGNKGIPILLNAFAEVSRRHPQARLVLKGLDAMYKSEEKLGKYIRCLPQHQIDWILPRIRYYGQTLTFAEMAKLYQAADAYVTPYHAEGFSMPVLEAVACGLPVICTQGGPTDDFTAPEFAFPIRSKTQMEDLSPSQCGALLMPDVDHLIERMNALIEGPETVSLARAAGPAHVSSRFTWGHVVGRLLDVLFETSTEPGGFTRP